MSEDALRTVEGTSWPIVLFVELLGERAKAWSRALEEANIIVLSEASILRAAFVVTSERPHVVLVASSLPSERTQVVRDAARDIGAEVLSLAPDLAPSAVRSLVEKSLATVLAVRKSVHPPRPA
ncbi:MAG: hypothetical protein KF819_07375 [Labilithrix sp.]|nr:hypothetical protein [Labilithrix sp.]